MKIEVISVHHTFSEAQRELHKRRAKDSKTWLRVLTFADALQPMDPRDGRFLLARIEQVSAASA